MRKSSKKPKSLSKEQRLKAFFINLTTNTLHDYEMQNSEEAKVNAIEFVNRDWTALKILFKTFHSWEATEYSLTIVTRPIIHKLLDDRASDLFRVGKATIVFTDGNAYPIVTFDNKDFKHGHIHHNGAIGCLGGFKCFRYTLTEEGCVALLTSILAFVTHSSYGTIGESHAREHDKASA